MRIGNIIHGLGRPIAFFPGLIPVVGGIKETLLLCQLIYWSDKGYDQEGWIYKTQAEIEKETGLTRDMQEAARKKLRATGILLEKKAGLPSKLYYRVDLEKLEERWEKHFSESHTQQDFQPPDKDAGFPHPRMGKTRRQECGFSADKSAGFPQTNIYTENTSETTTEIPPTPQGEPEPEGGGIGLGSDLITGKEGIATGPRKIKQEKRGDSLKDDSIQEEIEEPSGAKERPLREPQGVTTNVLAHWTTDECLQFWKQIVAYKLAGDRRLSAGKAEAIATATVERLKKGIAREGDLALLEKFQTGELEIKQRAKLEDALKGL